MKPDISLLLTLFDNDQDVVNKFVDAFYVKISTALDELPRFMASGDLSAISNQAHVLKTHAGYAGLNELVSKAQQLETAIDEQHGSGIIKEHFGELVVVLRQVQAAR